MLEFLEWYLACFLCTFGFCYLYYKLVDSKVKINLKICLVFLFGVLGMTLIKYYEINSLSFISFFIFYPYLFYLINNLSLKKLLFYSIFVWLYGVFFDFLFMVLLSLVNYVWNVNIYSPLFKIFPTALLSVALILFGNLKIIKRFTNYVYMLFTKIEYFNFIIIAISIFVIVVGVGLVINIKHLRISVLLFLVMFFLAMTIILLLKCRMDKLENKVFLKTLKENNDFYIKIDAENRIFKHNLAAKLLSIKSVSNKKAQVLIDDFLKHNSKTINYTKQIKEIPYGLNGIIYQKLYPYLDKLSIKINNQIKYDIFEVLTPRKYNVFVEKVLLSIDNAIESAIKSREKVIIVDLYDEENCIIFEIKNSFSDNLDIDDLGKIEYSTKSKKRGLGLFSMLREKEAIVKIEIINDIFVSKIKIKKRLIF